MIKKLYQKIYFYTLFILITSVILTTTTVNLITRHDFEKHFDEEFEKQIFVLREILLNQVKKEPDKLQNAIKELSDITKCDISYWKDDKCLYFCDQSQLLITKTVDYNKLIEEKNTQVIPPRKNREPIILSYLDKTDTKKGYIFVTLGKNFHHHPPKPRLPILTALFILLFLGLLLIPYTKYLLKPFKQLMKSIEYISEGNFSYTIEGSEKSDFKELIDAFNNMTLKIKDMLNQKQRLIADVSHELKTPLSKIRLGLELLLKEGKGSQKYIDKSILETEHLNNIIDDLLDVSELELNTDKFKLVKIDFRDIVNENIERNQFIFLENNLAINKNIMDKPAIVKIEKNLMERVFNNIFSNIAKYAPKSSMVDIILNVKEDTVLLTIRDYGEGVNKDQLEKIFEPFYRTDESRSRDTGGTGLGLAIVKKILDLHDAKIWASIPEDNKTGFVLNVELKLFQV